MDFKEYYKKQISLSEWFQDIGHSKTEAFRHEDNEKRERLKVLREIIQLPYDAPYQFTASDIAEPSTAFEQFLSEHGSELCALRLIPLRPDLPKHRMRGHTINEAVAWFHELGIDHTQYRADFVPHSERPLWSTIFVVNATGVHGEVIQGGLNQLTDGWHHDSEPITFHFDFHSWNLSSPFIHEKNLKSTIEKLQIHDKNVQMKIENQLGGKFHHNYLAGYFEALETEDFGFWFIDYNRILGDLYADFVASSEITEPIGNVPILSGQSASKGTAQGKVRIIPEEELQENGFVQGEVLVCSMTTPAYVPFIHMASAVVTDLGGILSHAAIICRELGKPCVVGTKNATQRLKNGDIVDVDANRGIVNRC